MYTTPISYCLLIPLNSVTPKKMKFKAKGLSLKFRGYDYLNPSKAWSFVQNHFDSYAFQSLKVLILTNTKKKHHWENAKYGQNSFHNYFVTEYWQHKCQVSIGTFWNNKFRQLDTPNASQHFLYNLSNLSISIPHHVLTQI